MAHTGFPTPTDVPAALAVAEQSVHPVARSDAASMWIHPDRLPACGARRQIDAPMCCQGAPALVEDQ